MSWILLEYNKYMSEVVLIEKPHFEVIGISYYSNWKLRKKRRNWEKIFAKTPPRYGKKIKKTRPRAHNPQAVAHQDHAVQDQMD